ncbi:MAG: DUF1116 domain-containing protein [Nitrososphaeria archaeon]|nr:DUF1116 domain-containing protein [Conexivisphaerales archaeon]
MSSFFDKKVKVLNVGLDSFYQDLIKEGAEAVKVDWKPPGGGVPRLLKVLEALETEETEEANRKAVEAFTSSDPVLVDIKLAKEVIPEITGKKFGHAGPPISWERMSGPLKGAVIGAAIYEGLAKDEKQVEELVTSGELSFIPNHDVSAVGPMAGVISPEMPVFIVKNSKGSNTAYTNFNEGVGKVLRYGAYSAEVIERLKWMKNVLFPILKEALEAHGPLPLRPIMSQALQMGDELHTRNNASTLLFLAELGPYMQGKGFSRSEVSQSYEFIAKNQLFFLNLAMAAGKVMMDSASNIKNSTLVTVMSRNGTDFGIKVSGLGKEWFVGSAPVPKTLFFPGFKEGDANPDIGDSAIMETNGFGAFASAASPAVAQVTGASVSEALRITRLMYEITMIRDKSFPIPYMNFEGVPRGIDLRLVLDTNTAPYINTGVAHKQAGMGTVGFGIVQAPIICFTKAIERYGELVGAL